MPNPEPTIRVSVDPSNPGQFLACCGLLELADRLRPSAEGWFDEGQFRITCGIGLRAILEALVREAPVEVLELRNGLPVRALIAPLRLSLGGDPPRTVTLDAWMTARVEKGVVVATANPPWNFWSGQQTSMRIWSALRDALTEQLARLSDEQLGNLFAHRILLSGRFGFDPGAAWNALDVGFSPNEQGMEVQSSAAVELLAAVGLQRFRPLLGDDRQSFTYATWGNALAPVVAAAAASGQVRFRNSRLYRGRVISRGQYAALGHSTPVRGRSDE